MGDFCYFLVVLAEANSEFQNKLFGDYPNNPYLCSTLTIKRKNMLTKRIISQSSTRILLFFVLLVAPFRVAAMSDKAMALYDRHLALFETDSVEAFLDVTKQLRTQLEKEGEEKKMYGIWINQVAYFLDIVSSSKHALEIADEMKEYAMQHDNKYGIYLSIIAHAYITSRTGLADRTEELLLQSIAYQKRYLPNERPSVQVYQLLTEPYNLRKQYKETIRIIDEALKLTTWDDRDRIYLLALKCGAFFDMEPTDTASFMKCYKQLYATMPPDHDDFSFMVYIDCNHARLTNDYSRLLKLSQSLAAPTARFENEYVAYEGLGRYKEALEAHKNLKMWQDSLQSVEVRKLTEMNALELQAARAENEANTLRMNNQRILFIAIVCGLLLIGAFLVIYLRRRQKQMRLLKQAYDQLEEVTTQKERIESELRIARDIQMSMVPGAFPEHEGLDMYASMTPAKEVGGDLYGYVLQGDNLYFCVGDVSGKGVPASLFMAQSARLFRTLAAEGMMPAAITSRMNNELVAGNDNLMFVTMFIGLVNLTTGHLSFCNAGHNAPVIDGEFLCMKKNLPLGVFADYDYQGEELESISGRQLFIYTDGLNEAENPAYEQFGNDRLLDMLRSAHDDTAQQVVDTLKAAVESHRNGAEPNDDLTMMCLRVN